MSTATGTAATPHSQKMAIRLNVIVAIVAALALVVVVNWFGSKRYYRRDVATLANYGLSDRMKSVLNSYRGEVRISTLYMPNEDDDKQQGVIRRLTDYCDELQRFSSNVKVTHVTSPIQREKLVASISGTFGGEAGKHKEALDSYSKLQTEMKGDLEHHLSESQQLMERESWLGDFPIFASIVATLKSDRDLLQKTTDEIRELTPQGGIPKYGDATTKAKTGLTEIKTHLQAIARGLHELAMLAEESNKPDTKWIPMLREVADQSAAAVLKLRETVGAEETTPGNVPAALKAFADRGLEVGTTLDGLVNRVDQFGKAFPIVRKHPNWGAAVQMGPMMARLEVSEVFEQASAALAKSRLVILGAIDSKDAGELSRALVNAQRNVTILEKNAATCQKLLRDLAQRLTSVDPGSKTMLDASREGKLFADRIAAIDDLDKQLTALPELKLASVADRLKEENTIVVEANGRIRVLSFNEVFTARESVAGPSKEDQSRAYNGDSAISSALLALTTDKPVATVMLVSYEPPAPQQRNQFMPPPPNSWVPSSQLSEFRKRLEAANFKVVDWNMATTPEEPAGEEGVPKVYVCLPPPPPAPPNPFGQQNPQEQVFGEAQRETIRKLLDADACVLFLATWEARPGGFFGGPPMTPPYGYGPLLEKDWGVRVENGRRMVWVDPDTKKANTINIIPRNFVHMPTVGFTNHEIGAPMRGTRFLINDACCLHVSETLPEGVSVQTVLQIPDRENYIGTTMTDLIYIIDEVQNPNSDGSITLRSTPQHGPFQVMLAAERKAENKRKGRIVVCGFGGSVRDDFLQQPVWAGGDRLRLDSPPTENADLLVNALYWLQDKPQWIARGPAAVPRVLPIEAAQARMLRVFVWGIWPALVFAPGLFLWHVRRK